MTLAVRTYLVAGLSVCLSALLFRANELNGAEVPTQAVPEAAAAAQESGSGESAEPQKTSQVETDEKPPKMPENPEQSAAPGHLLQLDGKLEAIEARSAAIRDNLKQAVDYASELSGAMDALAEKADTRNLNSISVAASGSAGVAGKVHVFIMADTRGRSGNSQNKIARSVGENAIRMKELFEDQCVDRQGGRNENHLASRGVVVLQGDTNFKFSRLQQEITAANVSADDVIVVYIACHGGSFPDGRNSHSFQMPHPRVAVEVVARSDVWSLMKGKKARQTILISDTCSNRMNVKSTDIPTAQAAGIPTHALSLLLLYQVGDVDISGSTRPPADNGDGRKAGQFGIYFVPGGGGLFTNAFESAALETPKPISWGNLFRTAQSTMSAQLAGRELTIDGVRMTRQTIERVED